MELTRRKFVELAGIGLVSISLEGFLAGCTPAPKQEGSASGSSTTKDAVVVAMTVNSEPEAGFDPFYGWGCGEHVHEPLIQSTLITTTKDLGFANDLATNYSCADDGMSWSFDIRDDVKFTDGTPLTAEDVAFTINGIKGFEGSELDLSSVKKVVADTPTHLTIQLERPFNALLFTLAIVGIVPKHAYDRKTYGKNPIGSGRYILKQWDKGQQVIFEANPDYYGEAPKMKRLTVVFLEEDASLAAAQSGQVDVAYTSALLADKTPNNYDLMSCQSVDCRGVSLPNSAPGKKKNDGTGDFPAGNAVTQHKEVRQAINYAVDRQKIIDNVLKGHGSAAYSICDSLPWGSPDVKVDTDLNKAASLLTDAGWKKGSDGIWAKDGQKAEFTLYYASNDSVRQAMASELSNQLKDFGISVATKGSTWTTDPDGLYAHEFSDPVVWGWGANSPMQFYTLYYSESPSNFADYQNKTTDKHMEDALAHPKVEDSYDDWRLAQWDGKVGPAPQGDAPWVWLANIDHLYFVRQGLHVAEQKIHPHGHGWSLVNNVDEWTW